MISELSKSLPPGLTLAPVGARIGAALIDFVIVNVACSIILIPFLRYFDFENRAKNLTDVMSSSDFANNPDPAVFQSVLGLALGALILCIVILVVYHSYYVLFESESGQTPGKKVLGLRVVTLEGGRITRRQALIREVLRWYVDIIFFLPAFISIYSTVRRQRVGDIFAKTMVVQVPKT